MCTSAHHSPRQAYGKAYTHLEGASQLLAQVRPMPRHILHLHTPTRCLDTQRTGVTRNVRARTRTRYRKTEPNTGTSRGSDPGSVTSLERQQTPHCAWAPAPAVRGRPHSRPVPPPRPGSSRTSLKVSDCASTAANAVVVRVPEPRPPVCRTSQGTRCAQPPSLSSLPACGA